jgi:hypothetical protein
MAFPHGLKLFNLRTGRCWRLDCFGGGRRTARAVSSQCSGGARGHLVVVVSEQKQRFAGRCRTLCYFRAGGGGVVVVRFVRSTRGISAGVHGGGTFVVVVVVTVVVVILVTAGAGAAAASRTKALGRHGVGSLMFLVHVLRLLLLLLLTFPHGSQEALQKQLFGADGQVGLWRPLP